MSHIVAISPHLDDAAFSVGGTLAARARAGDRITILTCFTGNVPSPTGFALACQLDKGLSPEVDYMALRRAEDHAACAVIGAHPIHLPLLEAPHRGYASAPELFGPRRDDDAMLAPLTATLDNYLEALRPDRLLGPLAVGNHVDHWLVREALQAIGREILLWEDWPYLTRAAIRPAEPVRQSHRLDASDRADRIAMCACYSSQIGFQFGSLAAMTASIGAIDAETLHISA